MKMLRQISTGREYVYSQFLARADGMEEFEAVEEFENEAPSEGVDAVRPLEDMTRDELIAMAEELAIAAGDSRSFTRMKKAELITVIRGEEA
ncbi:MAG: hypothetical protein EOM03_12025 [Clostridia bacterium]|nr:hypothetical protein [Clostridia bacterium]